MPKFKTFIAIISLFLLTSVSLFAQEYLWVSSPEAKLKSENKASSETIAVLKTGEKLTVEKTEDKWHFVKTASDKKGWIYRGKVSDTAPETNETDSDDSMGGLLSGLSGSSIEAETADTSRSIRGLSPEAKQYAQKTGTEKQYIQAVDRVLSFQTPASRIEAFLKKGNIGEYAE
jgi:uncharacterized protein YgiM (DUF1202 family)